MKKIIIIAILFFISYDHAFADRLHLGNGDVLHGKVVRVTRDYIEYQSAEDKTSKKILRSRVIQIEYDNGTSVYLFEMKNEENIPGKKSEYDKIFLDKDTVINGKIIEVTPKHIRYLPKNKNTPKLINRKNVVKIVYTNGAVVLLKETAAIQPGNSSFPQKKGKFRIFDINPVKKPNKPRSVFWMPILTFILPGLDQWWEGQYLSAVFYSGLAVLGISITSKDTDISNKQPWDKNLTDEEKKSFYGAQLYQTAGALSAFHCFRTAVKTHHNSGNGRFSFLKEEETTDDIILAPFKLTFLARPTTFIPIGLASGFAALALSGEKLGGLKGRDFLYISGLSYNAGTGEEALFRGWMMPLMMDYTNSGFWSNTATALLFAAVHISGDLKYPIGQFIAGWYLGWLTQKRNWTISESIFIHAWWDLILFTTMYFLYEREGDEVNVVLPLVFTRF